MRAGTADVALDREVNATGLSARPRHLASSPASPGQESVDTRCPAPDRHARRREESPLFAVRRQAGPTASSGAAASRSRAHSAVQQGAQAARRRNEPRELIARRKAPGPCSARSPSGRWTCCLGSHTSTATAHHIREVPSLLVPRTWNRWRSTRSSRGEAREHGAFPHSEALLCHASSPGGPPHPLSAKFVPPSRRRWLSVSIQTPLAW